MFDAIFLFIKLFSFRRSSTQIDRVTHAGKSFLLPKNIFLSVSFFPFWKFRGEFYDHHIAKVCKGYHTKLTIFLITPNFRSKLTTRHFCSFFSEKTQSRSENLRQ